MIWLVGWNYRKPITISNTGPILTDNLVGNGQLLRTFLEYMKV